jgi:hypothetical protein
VADATLVRLGGGQRQAGSLRAPARADDDALHAEHLR